MLKNEIFQGNVYNYLNKKLADSLFFIIFDSGTPVKSAQIR